MPTPQDVRKKGSKILKLPPVRNCFTLAMTNKLVVIINSLKVPQIKKILLYEMKFLVRNYSCLQNPWLRGYRPQIPVLSVFCPQLNLLNPPPRTKFLGTPLSGRGCRCCGAERQTDAGQDIHIFGYIDVRNILPRNILCVSNDMTRNLCCLHFQISIPIYLRCDIFA